MNKKLAICLLAVGAWGLSDSDLAVAGGTLVATVQDGDWNSVSTWDIRVPDASLFDSASILHVVDLTTPGANTHALRVGNFGGSGTLNITAGDLTVNIQSFLGNIESGILNLSGGTWSTPGFRIGFNSPGAMTISGGTLDSNGPGLEFLVIGTGPSGTLTIVGGDASITHTGPGAGDFILGDNGTIVIRPSANGSTGLSTIELTPGSVTLGTGSTLELDTSLYTPSVNDSWDLITYTGTLFGSFGNLVAPAGYTIVEDQSVPGVITIRVAGGAIPAASTWGLAVMSLLLLTAGTMAFARRQSGLT